MKTKHYIYIDCIRVLSLIAILLYHLNLLKGGFIAVCIFFSLTGYLSIQSLSKKENFSLKDYYWKRLKKIYLPLIIVVMTTLGIVLLFNTEWINLKAETKSVLLGYNNYWQLNAELDYFVRHISSPFIHLWFTSIILQFELVVPVLYLGLKKIKERTNEKVLYSILLLFAISSIILFSYKILNHQLMNAYYGTFSRSFSLLLGLGLGFFHIYHKPVHQNKKSNLIILSILSLLLILIFIFIDFKSSLLIPSMVGTTIISLLMIHLSAFEDNSFIFKNIILTLSNISYEIYLVQYPIIFFIQSIDINHFYRLVIILFLIIIISVLLHTIMDEKKNKIIRIVLCFLFGGLSILGTYQFIITKDNTKDMKKLQADLLENSKLIEKKQKEYQEKLKTEEDDYNTLINQLDSDKENLNEIVKNLKIVGIGDSIMELAIKDLYEVFPNGYFDAVENRTERQTKGVVEDLKNKGMLGDILLLNVGTNGSCLGECKEELMDIIGERKVYWLNATNADYDTFNPSLDDIASKHSNITIIDWVSVASAHPEYLIYDKVHPTVTGCRVYAETIYNAIYEDFLKDLDNKKEEQVKQHEEELKKKITFIGNDLLLGSYVYMKDYFPDSNFITQEDLTNKKLLEIIKKNIKDKTFSNNIVIMLDQKTNLKKKELEEIVNLCKEYQLTIVDVDHSIKEEENIRIIPFYKEIEKHKDYLSYDNIHLTEKGYQELSNKIYSYLNT
ncbi:MAG: acyltransferase [Bacilli bacterium]|nr:acyltransferase [Bacilli bacterium]